MIWPARSDTGLVMTLGSIKWVYDVLEAPTRRPRFDHGIQKELTRMFDITTTTTVHHRRGAAEHSVSNMAP